MNDEPKEMVTTLLPALTKCQQWEYPVFVVLGQQHLNDIGEHQVWCVYDKLGFSLGTVSLFK
jgi:hypothetical protein